MRVESFAQETKRIFRSFFQNTLTKSVVDREAIDEAAFPAYAHKNPLVEMFFWGRLKKIEAYILNTKTTHFDNMRVLDFGCGSGVMAYMVGKNGYQVDMTDIDERPYRYVKKSIEFPKTVRWVSSDGVRIRESTYDIILALDVLEHVDDIKEVVKELQSKLKEGGKIIVSGPTENVLYRLGRRLAGKRFTGHYHHSTIDDIRAICEEVMDVKDITVLYPIIPLFKVFVCTKRIE